MLHASCETVLQRAEAVDASAIVTGTALYWLNRIARQSAWDQWHSQQQPLSVTELTIIRGRSVQLRLFISRYGATYCRRWKVDGHAWTAAEVNQAFGF